MWCLRFVNLRFVTSTLCASTFSNSYDKWHLRYVMLRFVAVPWHDWSYWIKSIAQAHFNVCVSRKKVLLTRELGFFTKQILFTGKLCLLWAYVLSYKVYSIQCFHILGLDCTFLLQNSNSTYFPFLLQLIPLCWISKFLLLWNLVFAPKYSWLCYLTIWCFPIRIIKLFNPLNSVYF